MLEKWVDQLRSVLGGMRSIPFKPLVLLNMTAVMSAGYQSVTKNSLIIAVPQWTIKIVQFINISCYSCIQTTAYCRKNIYCPTKRAWFLRKLALLLGLLFFLLIQSYRPLWKTKTRISSGSYEPDGSKASLYLFAKNHCNLRGNLWPDIGVIFVKSMEHWVIFWWCVSFVAVVLECSIFTTAEIYTCT